MAHADAADTDTDNAAGADTEAEADTETETETDGGSESEAEAASRSPIRDRPPIETGRALSLLRGGEVSLLGRMPYSSNATFLVDVAHEGLEAQAVYKPVRGERPLWDFPSGLAHREAGAFCMAEALGWDVVPPTVVRGDLPFGEGSLQLFMPAHFEEHYFTLVQQQQFRGELRRICALDLAINNTDRKSGHCLLGTDGTLWAIDNGLSFHAQFKLRTVIWDFASEPLPEDLTRDLAGLLGDGLPEPLSAALTPLERDATVTRVEAILAEGRFPSDDGDHRWPWPLV
ncbi:MAG: SCO1664 family protein [Acidimicrobiaceae bacterium]|nr:SCO1664 family protein [Acidimicrobiaceae bacterium]